MRLRTLLCTLCLLHAIAGADPVPCDKTLINGFKQDKMTYTGSKLTCNKDYQALGYTDGAGADKESPSLACDPMTTWKDEAGVDTTFPAAQAITVTCVEVPCHAKRVELENGAIFTAPATPTDHPTLKCTPPKQLTIEGNPYSDLQCEKGTNKGWTDTSGATKFKNIATFTAKCSDPAAPPPSGMCYRVRNTGESSVHFAHTLTAPTCARSLPEAEATFKQDVLECVTAGKGLKFNSKLYSSLTCTEGKWKDKDGNKLIDDTVLLTATCEYGCRNIKKPSTTPGGVVEDGISDKVDISTQGVFKCKSGTTPDKIFGIKINEEPLKSKIFCDIDKGWTDFTKTANKYAGALEAVTLSCESTKCPDGVGKPICSAFTTSVNADPLPAGYECLEANPSPFDLTDNLNQLNCLEAQQKSQLYGLKEEKFYDDAPVCGDDAKWHDPAKNTIIPEDSNRLICLRKRCNSCGKLVEATGSATASTYTEGTASECAMATCPKSLWMIQKEGATSEVEYAGEVTCSTEKGTDNKWLIDGKDAIEKGSCLTSVKCKEAVRLNTACEAAWTGCAEPTLSDDAAAPCKDNKKMFYKKLEDKYFEGNVTSIECNKDKGHWKVKTSGREDQLKRGGSLVCADENPLPKPPPPACWVCPNSTDTQSPFTFRKTCNTCTDKDIQIKANDTAGTCEASVEYMTPIQFNTEKAGVVEGKLHCAADGVWRSADGKEVGRFAAYLPDKTDEQKKQEEQGTKAIIIGGSIGGVILLVVILIVVFKVVMGSRKRKTEEEKEKEEKRKRMAEEGKKRQKSRGNNDEILDEVSSQAPSEIKL